MVMLALGVCAPQKSVTLADEMNRGQGMGLKNRCRSTTDPIAPLSLSDNAPGR